MTAGEDQIPPGAHSDIRGGYPDNFHEHIQVADEGWLGLYNPDGTLKVEDAYRRRLKEGEVELQFRLWLDRRVQAEYSRVALRQMYRLAKDAGVPLNAVKSTDTGFSLPDELQPIATRITHHINEGRPLQLSTQEEALLRQRYIHHSAHYQTAGPLFPFKPAPGGVRGVYPNKGLK